MKKVTFSIISLVIIFSLAILNPYESKANEKLSTEKINGLDFRCVQDPNVKLGNEKICTHKDQVTGYRIIRITENTDGTRKIENASKDYEIWVGTFEAGDTGTGPMKKVH